MIKSSLPGFRMRRLGPPAVAGVALLLAWEFLPGLFDVSELLIPPASKVAHALWNGFKSGVIVGNFGITLFEALAGFAIGSAAGIVCAALLTRSKTVETALMPYLVGLQALPKVALAPLLVVWLGFGVGSKIAIATIISFFPVLINSIIGFTTIESEKMELMHSLVASKWQTFRIVVFPNALPFIFAGLNVAIVFSITGALVGEFIGADKGLGHVLMQLNFSMDIAGMFAVLFVLAVMGFTFYAVVRALHRRVVFWAEPDNLDRDAT
ncbi:MAG: ABC transporter permease [Acidimicrobiia bacterium]|nr:ABC transporter permease [Acidimicrobiia bacterium]